jgi:hypothetical protein
MATFYYDRHSNVDIYSQWTNHIQTNAYVRDIDSIVSQNRQELQSTIQNSSAEQARAIQNVCGKIEDGFREVNGHLSDINFNISGLRSEINEMASMLDWKLSMLIEEQRVTNQLLGHIANLLRIPDSQKQRVYYIEQGLKYLKNALLEGSKSLFYDDSLDGFKEAEKIEHKDYITLKRIGQIYLYSAKYMNIPLAEEYFVKSGREALAEANAGGTTTSNHFRPNDSDTGIYSENLFQAEAAEAYIYAGRTCYLQQKMSQAIEYAEKAYKLVPGFLEAGFEQAKYLAANNQVFEAVKVLETVINKDRFFSLKTLIEKDLSSKKPILDLLESLQQKAVDKATLEFAECKRIMSAESTAKSIITEIENYISKNNYLSAMKAIDLLHAEYQLPYKTLNYDEGHVRIISYSNEKNKDSFMYTPPKHSLPKFLEIEKKSNLEVQQFIISSDKAQNNRKIIAALKGGGIGFVVAFIVGAIFPSVAWIAMIVCIGIGAYFNYNTTE